MFVLYVLFKDKNLALKNIHVAPANKKSLRMTLVPGFYFLIPTLHERDRL